MPQTDDPMGPLPPLPPADPAAGGWDNGAGGAVNPAGQSFADFDPGPGALLDPNLAMNIGNGNFLGMRIPSGDELYNSLMAAIEPELTTDQLPLLTDRYKSETPEESKARAKRYEKAFAEYDTQLKNYMEDLHQKLKMHQRIAMSSAELGARTEEQEALSTIEDNIQKS